ncbi:hypothetical protein SCLCIDRAFT_1209794 [Scleroderma citrinum Foug A]|uniref:Uncharacterized protein n=1 Tax=Scleroderma citrinum Foug A TaxID=1036808 RepID=A0A0C3EIF5_9AGAM|nr:hypothetical protein SCLCIDRAFT_1209794 [Scleroderma citrinum Foug A]
MAPTYSLPSFPSPPRTTQHVNQGANRSLVSLLLLALFLGACVGYVPIYLLYRCWEARRLKNSSNASKMETWTVVHSFGSRHPDNKDNHSNIETTFEGLSGTRITQSEEQTFRSDTSFRPTLPPRAVLADRVGSDRSLSHDRAAQIIANPKLAPVQGPLRPLSTENPSYGRQLSTLFLLLCARFKRRQKDSGGSMDEGRSGGAI